jgi:sec-independent protein translocase protein TatA
MGTFSIWHWLVVLAVVLLLFGGRGKISQIMGDFGKGLRSFKQNIKEEEEGSEGDEPKAIENETAQRAESAESEKKEKANSTS